MAIAISLLDFMELLAFSLLYLTLMYCFTNEPIRSEVLLSPFHRREN